MRTSHKGISVLVAPGRTRLLLAAAAVLVVPLAALLPQGAQATTTPDANLLTGDTATLAGSVGTWVGQSASVARPSSGVLSVRASASGMVGALSGLGDSAVPATPGRVYAGSLEVKAATTTRMVSAVLQFRAQDGSLLATAFGQPGAESTTGWVTTHRATGIAPEGTVGVVLAEAVGSAATGEVHYLKQPRLTVLPVGGRDLVGPLTTSGNQVYDANGAIVLQGLNRIGLQAPNPLEMTPAEFAQAKRWGATMVRLPVSSSYWLSSNCNYRSSYADAVDKAVQAVTALKMVALIDLHTNTMVACGTVKQQRMADPTALDFWRQVANRYKSNPLVAFDLYNEPHDISDSVWLKGGRISAGGSVFSVTGMQPMYDAVRSTGARNLVFISGNGWASNPPPTLVQGTNIVYALHAYTCPSKDWSKCTANPLDPTQILQRWEGLSGTLPVAVTEFGWPDKNDGRYNANVLRYLQARGWAWTAFAWDGVTSGDFSLLNTVDSSFEPSAAGMPILAGLNRG